MLDPYFLPEVFSHSECAAIIRAAEAELFDRAGLVRGNRNDNIRRARIAWLDESGATSWVFDRLVDRVIATNRIHFGFDLTHFSERMQIAWYDAEAGGHFDWHVDIGDGQFAARRKLTFVVQLSADGTYDGGDLELNANGQIRAAPRAAGSGVLFPSFVLHRVTPVIKSDRYSLTTWIHGPDFR